MLLLNVTLDEPDRALLEKVYREFRNAMVFEAYSITENISDAEDAVQEVFLRIARKHMQTLARLSEENKLKYYLLSAVRNTAWNLSQKASARHEIPLDPAARSGTEPSDESFIDRLSDALDARELVRIILELKPIYRDVLYQHFVLELSVREIADIDHLKTSAVKKRLLRGKQLLLTKQEEQL